jgi:hypothetical protein
MAGKPVHMSKDNFGRFSQETLVGITGRKGHGKDTIGKTLCQDYGFTRLAFGDTLKEVCRDIFGFSDEQLYGDEKEVIDPYWRVVPRDVYQVIGTELLRNTLPRYFPHLGKNIWVESLEKKYGESYKGKRVVITDVRFQNEIDMIRRHGGVILRVKRDVESRAFSGHESENYIDTFEVDCEIHNTSLAQLQSRVRELFS